MKKIFISQLMKNRSDEEILNERKEIEDYISDILDEDFEIIDSFFDLQPMNDVNNGVWYLGHSLIKLAEADLVVFGKNWQKGRGTVVEHKVAKEYGICILEL